MTFLSYQDELNEIWRDNVAATKCAILKEEEADVSDSMAVCIRKNHDCKGQVIIKVHKVVCICYCHNHQFVTKIPELNTCNCSIKRRNRIKGP